MLDPLCNLAGLAIGACSWAQAHTKYIGQVMGSCRTVKIFSLCAHLWAVHSLINGLGSIRSLNTLLSIPIPTPFFAIPFQFLSKGKPYIFVYACVNLVY